MKNKYLITILALLLVICVGSFLIFKKNNQTDLKVTTLQKNLTWGTGFEKNIPYKKGDELDLYYILEGIGIFSFDINDLKNRFDLKEIYLDGKKSDIDGIRKIKISKDKPTLIRIRAISKSNKASQKDNDIKITQTEKIEDKQIIQKDKIISKGTPSKILISQTKFNSNINNILSIKGDNLASIQYIMIGEKAFEPIMENKVAYIPIPKDIFGTGDYFIMINTFEGKVIPINYKISFEYSKNKINIAFITPQIIDNNDDRYIVLQGNGFSKLISLQLSNNIVLKNTEFKVINDNVVSVRIPKDIPAGSYNFNMMDTSGIYEEQKTLKIEE